MKTAGNRVINGRDISIRSEFAVVSVFASMGIVAVWSLARETLKKPRAHRINGVARALREVEI